MHSNLETILLQFASTEDKSYSYKSAVCNVFDYCVYPNFTEIPQKNSVHAACSNGLPTSLRSLRRRLFANKPSTVFIYVILYQRVLQDC